MFFFCNKYEIINYIFLKYYINKTVFFYPKTEFSYWRWPFCAKQHIFSNTDNLFWTRNFYFGNSSSNKTTLKQHVFRISILKMLKLLFSTFVLLTIIFCGTSKAEETHQEKSIYCYYDSRAFYRQGWNFHYIICIILTLTTYVCMYVCHFHSIFLDFSFHAYHIC